MAARMAHWPGRRVRRWLFAIWSTASLAACAKHQFGSSYVLDVFPCVLAWAAAFVLLTCITTLVAGIRESWREGLPSCVESMGFLVATLVAMFGLQCAFRGLGLGHWPPPDHIYARRFRDMRSDWVAERDRVLGELKAAAVDPARSAELLRRPIQLGYHYLIDGRVRELGAEAAVVANGGEWIKFIFYEGQIHHDPIREKGLLYVDPAFAARADTRWIDHLAVENLGGGWYVYEE